MLEMKIKTGVAFSMKNLTYAACFGLMVLLLPSCAKDANNDSSKDKAHITVKMTDAPANYDAVMVDVVGVEIIGSNDDAVSLNATAGVYNLLDLSNGISTPIASGDLEPGTISQIRLILGPNNKVVVDGVDFPLSTPSAMQSGLKLQVHQTLEPGASYIMLLDFDASQSVVLKGNGEYQLKPVIRNVDMAIAGSIEGTITPIGLIATVTATSNGVSYSSVTNASGAFMIVGLPTGTYDITVTPDLPLLPITVIGKAVVIGASTNIGVVIL